MTIFIFTLLCDASERFHFFEAPKRSLRIKTLCHFLPLFHWDDKASAELPTYANSVSLTTEIDKNNIDTFGVTNKQYKILLLFVSNETDIEF